MPLEKFIRYFKLKARVRSWCVMIDTPPSSSVCFSRMLPSADSPSVVNFTPSSETSILTNSPRIVRSRTIRANSHTDVIVGFWDAEGIRVDVHEFQSVLRDSVGTYTVVALPS